MADQTRGDELTALETRTTRFDLERRAAGRIAELERGLTIARDYLAQGFIGSAQTAIEDALKGQSLD